MAQLTMGQGSVNAGGGVQYPFSSQEIERQRVQEWEGRMVARMIEDSVQLRTAMAAAGLQLPTTGGIGAVGPPEVYSQQSVGGIRNILTGQQGPGMSMLGTAIGGQAVGQGIPPQTSVLLGPGPAGLALGTRGQASGNMQHLHRRRRPRE